MDKIFEIEYNYLISHTFPGIFLWFEIILAFSLFTPINIFNMLCSVDYKIINIIILIIIIYIISTLLGIVLDGIHHYIFAKWESNNKSLKEQFEIYEYISSIEQLQICKQTVDKDYWYYYECYANLAIAMIPGILLFPYWFIKLDIVIWFIIIFVVLYLCVIIINIQQALSALKMVQALENALLNNFKNLRS